MPWPRAPVKSGNAGSNQTASYLTTGPPPTHDVSDRTKHREGAMAIKEYEPGTAFPGVMGRTIGESSPAWPRPLRAKPGVASSNLASRARLIGVNSHDRPHA